MAKHTGDPIGKYKRKAIAERRTKGNQCACGESRPAALIANSSPTICAECMRERNGQSVLDNHHPAGRVNNPATIPIPVNDHRAVLTEKQLDWPKRTWENPDGSPLLAGASSIRGHYETVEYLTEMLVIRNAELFEALDEYLSRRLGPTWWVDTPVERFAPKRKR
jgi:hypothetical protein